MNTLNALVYVDVFHNEKTLVTIPLDEIIRGVGRPASCSVEALAKSQERFPHILYIAEKLRDERYIIDSSETTYDEARKYGWLV
jgi:hypothetical protein